MSSQVALQITGILLAGLLSVIFVSYLLVSFSEGKRPTRVGLPRKLSGAFAIALGSVLSISWIYFMVNGWESFWTQAAQLSVHVLTELASSLTLTISGIAMIRGWSRGPALFLTANALLILTLVLALAAYSTSGHPFLMNGISILLVIASVYMVGLVYGWEHFVLHLDEPEASFKKSA